MFEPDCDTETFNVPPVAKPLIGSVKVVPEPVRIPFCTPETPLNEISLAVSPEITWENTSVNCVVVCVSEPFAVTLFNVIETTGAVGLLVILPELSERVTVTVSVESRSAVCTVYELSLEPMTFPLRCH